MTKKYVVRKGGMFWPSEEMKKIAWVKDDTIYKEAQKNPVQFWENLAREGITWEQEWTKAYKEKLPYFGTWSWFLSSFLSHIEVVFQPDNVSDHKASFKFSWTDDAEPGRYEADDLYAAEGSTRYIWTVDFANLSGASESCSC